MIASALKKFFSPDPQQLPAHEAYVRLVAQSRLPFFYREAGVPDTLDGRFDVITLHVFLVTRRLRPHAPAFIRALWEAFFSDMDRNLREMGASDTGVGKRIKKMVQAFYGRMDAYEKTADDEAAFKESLSRNLYRGADIDDAALTAMTAYITRNTASLQQQDADVLIRGEMTFVS